MATLLLDEYFDAQDDRLLPELLKARGMGLAHFAHKLLADPRPFGRRLVLQYLALGCDRVGHRAFVKTLFKEAEAKPDWELLAHLLVSFDRLVPTELRTEWAYDPQTRRSTQRQVLREVGSLRKRYAIYRQRGFLRTSNPKAERRAYTNPVTRKKTPLVRNWEGEGQGDAFSLGTRRYLQRRVFRAFRGLAKKDPAAYRRWASLALSLYRDEHLVTVNQVLSSWGYVHLLYRDSKVLRRQPLGVEVAPGYAFTQLELAPHAPQVWADGKDELLQLASTAASRPVRRFALAQLRAHHLAALAQLPIATVMAWLKSEHEELQELGSALLDQVQGLGSLPISEWLALVRTPNPLVVEQLCRALRKHVAPGRLTLAQCVELGQAGAAPVADLGLAWAKEKVKTVDDLSAFLGLRNAPVEDVRVAAMEWAVQQLVLEDAARPLLVRELLDAKYVDVRAQALTLMEKDRRFGDALELWLAMSETPYADVRGKLLASLGPKEQAFSKGALHRVWATALLDVHRGARTRRKVARQVASRVVREQAERAELLTLLGHVLRSVRPAERGAALAQVARAATADPTLKERLQVRFGELQFLGDEVSA